MNNSLKSGSKIKRSLTKIPYSYGFKDSEQPVFSSDYGLSEDVVKIISKKKNEPGWMFEKRLKALKYFFEKPMPRWGADLSSIDFQKLRYYVRPTDQKEDTWEKVPDQIKKTFDRLRIPEFERKFLSGVGAQYDSENVYHHVTERIRDLGVVFSDVETACYEYPELVKKYFGTIVPAGDNKFAALNTAVWSGGSFIYVPKGVTVDLPLQAYFRINAESIGQFERTLIIADVGSSVHYIEGCSAPIYRGGSLHAAVVEIVALKGAKVRYTTVQNWSKNVYNLVTKRAAAYESATVEWVDFNIGSHTTMKYPSVYLLGENSRADILSMAFAGEGQHLEAGAKVIHKAPNTTSIIRSKSISQGGGRTTYRGLVDIGPEAAYAKSRVFCDALIIDEHSKAETFPTIRAKNGDATVEHEATVSSIGEDELHYLKSRGLNSEAAHALIVNGFIEPIAKELPMEYALEMNRIIELSMEGSVG